MVDGCGTDAELVITVAVEVSSLTGMGTLSEEADRLCVRACGIGSHGVVLAGGGMAPFLRELLAVP